MTRPVNLARIPSREAHSPDGIRATVAGALPRTVVCQRGFTLVELVMVIAIAGLVAVLISTVMSNPLQGLVDQSRRAELVDKASMALNRMAREIRLAVPNSLTVTGTALNMLPIAAAGRYRANQPNGAGPRQDPPQCTQTGPACSIELLSPLTASATPHWLIIYNTAVAELGSTASPSVISPKSFTWTTSTLSANLQNFRFKYASPQHRFYLAREVVSYRCAGAGLDPAGTGQGKLWRDSSANLDGSSASQALLVDGLSSCAFDYAVATNTRSGLVTLRLTLAEAGETITLLQQVHVDNAP